MAFVDPKVAEKVAKMAEIRTAVRAQRDEMFDIAEGLFAPHNHPGRHELKKANGKVDAFLLFEGPSFESVMSVEFGHWTPGHKRHVEGLHILTRTIAQAAR